MNDKNTILNNLISVLAGYSSELINIVGMLGNNVDVNYSIIDSAYTIMPAISAEVTLIQRALDEYKTEGGA